MRRRLYLLLSLVACAAVIVGCSRKAGSFMTIGTGAVTGVYYPVGKAIADIVNGSGDETGIRASVQSTGGSVYNINAVLSGDLEFGVAQSDRQYQAVKGLGEWDGNPRSELRAVFSLHPEIVTLVAAEDSGIASVEDLRGKRVNIGNPGSGHRGNAMQIFSILMPDWEDALRAESLKAAEAPKMLQDGRLDAFFYTVGHPNGAIQEATSGRRKVRFVPITGLDRLIADHPYYAHAEIPIESGMYPMAVNDANVPSIGVVTTFVTSSATPDDLVYQVVKGVFENIETFRTLHPALQGLTREGMLKGLSAPLHPGAERYFREAGLLP